MPIKKKAPQGDDYAATASTEDDVFEEENPDEIAEFSQSRSRGWGAADEKLESSKGSGGSGSHFKFSEEQELIAFVDGQPIDVFDQHWLNNREGQKSFRCLEEECPLCAAGDSPSPRFTFSILHFEEENGEIDPTIKLMTVGVKALKQLKAIDEDPKRGGPLEGKFFSAYRTGKKRDTVHTFTPVKLRDVEEDWEIPQDEAVSALKEAQEGPEPKVWIDSLETLREVASELKRSA